MTSTAEPATAGPTLDLGAELQRLGRRRTTVPRGAVLETSAFRLLWLLSDGGPRTLREVADELDLEQSTVNRQVNAAIRAGLVERLEATDGPARRVRPTADGTAAFEHDGALRLQRLAEVLEHLGPRRSADLLEHLRAFNDAFDEVLRRS